MFADSMLETSWAQRSRRSWTTLTSIGLQALLVGLLLLLPLIRPVALPFLRPLPTPVMMSVPPGPPAGSAQRTPPRTGNSNLENGRIITPPSIPTHIRVFRENEDVLPPQVTATGPFVFGSSGSSGAPNGVLNSPGNPSNPLPIPQPTVPSHPLRVSQMSLGDLIRKVQPVYPPLARSARIQGDVILTAVISKEGAIENLRVLSGHPMLAPAALEAVRQWRYRPYLLNREPVEVETQITVRFSLSGN